MGKAKVISVTPIKDAQAEEADSQSRGDEEFNAITDEDSESAKPKQAWQRRSIFNSYGLRRVDKTDEMDEESSHKNGCPEHP